MNEKALEYPIGPTSGVEKGPARIIILINNRWSVFMGVSRHSTQKGRPWFYGSFPDQASCQVGDRGGGDEGEGVWQVHHFEKYVHGHRTKTSSWC